MEFKWHTGSQPDYIQPCMSRDGIFEKLPTDVIQVMRLGILPKPIGLNTNIPNEMDLLIVPTELGLVVATEMAWFAQHTRTNDAYETHGSVDKYGILISNEKFRKNSWAETSHWYHILIEIGKRYNLSSDDMDKLRITACYLFSRRRLGKRKLPFCVVIASCLEKRAIWIDISYQQPTVTNITPFVYHDAVHLVHKQLVCTLCKKVCTKKCKKCNITPYCNRECQKKDFKSHKKVCLQNTQVVSLKDVFIKKKDTRYNIPKDIDFYNILNDQI